MFEQLREFVRAAPFEPFRIHLNDGRHFDVHHPEFIAVSRSTVHVGQATDDDEAPKYMAVLQLQNITSVERLTSSPQQSA